MNVAPPRSLYQARRRRLMRLMGDGVAIIPTAPEQIRNGDAHYPYRADSYFHYLTGFDEPEAILVMVVQGSRLFTLLFCRERNPLRELWDGHRLGVEQAPLQLGVDEALPITRFDEMLPELLSGQEQLQTLWGISAAWDQRLLQGVEKVRQRVRSGVSAPLQFTEIRQHLDEMRLIKDATEVRLMKHAGRISAGAHARLMRAVRPGAFEYEMEALLLHEFRRHGADAPAYTSIVAGGANACVLHYVKNTDPLKDGDLLLVDAGCEYQGYASDITRTFPVNGRFSAPQRDLYEIVWAAQQAALKAVRPGRRFEQYHHAAVKVLAQGLIDVGLCRGSLDGVIESGDYQRFYMHRTGHWLGRDVHDVGSYTVQGKSRPLKAGMVVTVEPGLYVGKGRGIPAHFANTGIRVEDDALVTATGCEVITDRVPSQIDQIEAWMRGE